MEHCDIGGEWFAAHVWAGRERRSAEHLRSRGYEVCLPTYFDHHRWSDRYKKVEKALFPGYVFFRVVGAIVGSVVSCPGVVRIVGNGDGPERIATDEIEGIRRIVEARLHVEPWAYLRAGQQICIEHGPLRGASGIVIRTKSRRRLIVSVTLLQRSVAVDLDADWVSVPLTSVLTDGD